MSKIKKGWPKSPQENAINEFAPKIAQDSLAEQGFEAKLHDAKNPAAMVHRRIPPEGQERYRWWNRGTANADLDNLGHHTPEEQSYQTEHGLESTHGAAFGYGHDTPDSEKWSPADINANVHGKENKFWEQAQQPPDTSAEVPGAYHPHSVFAMRERAKKAGLLKNNLNVMNKNLPGAAPVAPPALHTNVESFMGTLKGLPKDGPARGKFITSHMNHGPFLQALQSHPQGKQVHGMLTNFLNSKANAGAGKGVVVAKGESDSDCVHPEHGHTPCEPDVGHGHAYRAPSKKKLTLVDGGKVPASWDSAVKETIKEGPKKERHLKIVKSEKDDNEHKLKLPLWKGKEILDEDHQHDLDQRSAIHEFEGKMPQDQAEDKAYSDYKREHQLKAAASHFMGMKAARAAGEPDEVKKHHTMYALHMKNLGMDANGPVPQEVEHHISTHKKEPFYRFQAHKGDSFLVNAKDKKKP